MLLGYAGLASAATSGASAPDAVPAEEITIYGDRHARWDDTRWWVHSEGILPTGLTLDDGEGHSFVAVAWQIRLLLHCRQGEPQLWDGIEVDCVVEDTSLRAASADRWRRPRDLLLVQTTLDTLDAKLTGAVLQLQVSASGTVPNIDIEGIVSDNHPRRQSQEALRQLLSRAVAGFALPVSTDSPWIERHSALMALPNATASRGTSTIVHHASPLTQTERRIASAGEGVTALPLPGSIGAEVMFSMQLASEARVRLSDGVMTYRRWTVAGAPTPSSPVRERCQMAGELQLLGDGEAPDVGKSAQLSAPGESREGIEAWSALTSL